MAIQAQIPGGGFLNENSGNESQIPGYQYVNQTQATTVPAITSVSGDDTVLASELNVAVVGTGFGSIQGTAAIAISQGAYSVNQTIDAGLWTNTYAQFDVVQSGLRYGVSTTLTLTNNDGYAGTKAITFSPATGKTYVNLSGYPAALSVVIGASATILPSDGDQVEYSTSASNGGTVTVNADGTYSVTVNTPCTFAYRIWYSATNTWSASLTANAYNTGDRFVVLLPPPGKGYVNLSGYPAPFPAKVVGTGASPSLVSGDQVEYDLLSNLGNAVTVNPDGSFFIDASVSCNFTYRVWDATDKTWSNVATIYVTV
jgi:hypothetical protein